MADTSEQPHPTPLELQQYIVAQTAGFYAFLHHAVTDYTESGKLPGPVFSAAGKVSGTRGSKATKEPREKRRMTAFNYFVQQKMHEYKESGKNPEPGSSLFTDASKEWTNLGAEEKEHFVAEFKRTHGQDGGSGGAVELPKTPAAAPAGGNTVDEGIKSEKKKKKKHKHKEGEEDTDGAKQKKKKKKHKHAAEGGSGE